MFVSTEAPEDFNEYHFEIGRFFSSPAATVDWIAHLHGKHWFDAKDFCFMMKRFREATGSSGALASYAYDDEELLGITGE